jgi:hypothetical protein
MPTTEDEKLQTDIDESNIEQSEDVRDRLTEIAARQLAVSDRFKQPLITKWKKYENLKAGNVPKKLRTLFSVPLPVFSGMLDTLAADFDEPIELRFKEKHPADYFKAKKYQGAFNIEKASYDSSARWDYKARVDKQLNILHGRSILKEYASSDPKYKNFLYNTDPLYFHCQPAGGGLLEDHLFAGEEGIIRTESELLASDIYDKSQVNELIRRSADKEFIQKTSEWDREKLQRFNVLGLDPTSNSYVGEPTFNLVEWVLTHKGKRYYVLFDPWTRTWVRCEPLKDIFSQDLYPWTSWATHNDNKVFWTQAYADQIYPVADAVVTLYNQELTNREKQNMNARLYDPEMFPDVAKLDEASYRPDALVRVDTKGGTRKIESGLFSIKTPELNGTIQLLDWTNKELAKDTGINDISQGVAMNAAKKVNVAYMESSATAKRLGLKSQSYTECWGEIGVRFIQGIKDHMSKEMYITVLGDEGLEPDVLTRADTDFKGGMLSVEVISSTAEKAENQKKKDGRIKMYELLAQSQNINSEMRDAGIMRDVGELNEEQITMFLDTKNYSAKQSVAKAHIAIQEILADKKPDINYAADTTFMKIILDYAMEHRNKLGKEKFKAMTLYAATHAQMASQNGQQRGKQRGQQNARTAIQANPGAFTPPQGKMAGAAQPPRPPMGAPAPQAPVPSPMAAPQPEMAQ